MVKKSDMVCRCAPRRPRKAKRPSRPRRQVLPSEGVIRPTTTLTAPITLQASVRTAAREMREMGTQTAPSAERSIEVQTTPSAGRSIEVQTALAPKAIPINERLNIPYTSTAGRSFKTKLTAPSEAEEKKLVGRRPKAESERLALESKMAAAGLK